jgi:hypothetical protein
VFNSHVPHLGVCNRFCAASCNSKPPLQIDLNSIASPNGALEVGYQKSEEQLKKKSYQTVAEKKILKILHDYAGLSKNKIMQLAKVSHRRCTETLDDLLRGQYLTLQDERYVITNLGITYLGEMSKRDKRGRQSRSQLTGRG